MAIYGIRNRPDFANYVSSMHGNRAESARHILPNKRYYSSIDAEIYFGEYYIDEITSIAFSIDQSAMPLFGYNSYTFDEMALGSRMINGQFTVNFTSANYLMSLIEKLESSSLVVYQDKTEMTDDGEKKEASFTDYTIQERSGSNRFTTSAYGQIKQGRRPLWYTGFDIDVMIGRPTSDKKTAEHLVLEGAYLTSSMINLDTNGQPISETYQFIARDIHYKTA